MSFDNFMAPPFYVLNEKREPVPTFDVLEWGIFFETRQRIVRQTEGPSFWVSTVFIGIPSARSLVFGRDDLDLFETMVWIGDHAEGRWFSQTWEEAEETHARVLAEFLTMHAISEDQVRDVHEKESKPHD